MYTSEDERSNNPKEVAKNLGVTHVETGDLQKTKPGKGVGGEKVDTNNVFVPPTNRKP